MLEVLYKKGMVLAIICLFIGAGVVPSISGNLENINYENKEIYNNNINIDEYIDLIVTDIWENNNTIYFQIQNIGTMYSEYECYAALYIDDNFTTDFLINICLGPQERNESYFDYFWYCSSLHDTIRVIIDYTDVVEEIDELNNEREEVWKCDNDPPTIVSGPRVINIAQNSVELFWETDDLSDSRVIFGKTAKEFSSEVIDDEYVTNHAIIIDDLEPSSVYHYVVESTDASNNRVVSSDMIFETSDEIDPEKPTIDLVVPGEINETVFLTAFAEDNIDIEKVEFYLGDTLLHTDFSKPYNYIFNSKEFSNGDYIVKGKAFDLVGNSNEEEEEAAVSNTIDNNPPYVNFVQPADGSQVEGVVDYCWVSLLDLESGLKCVDCYVDDTLVYSVEFKNPILSYTLNFWFNSLCFEDGEHSLTAIAYDVTRKESSDSITIFIKNEKPIDPVFFIKKHEIVRDRNFFEVFLEIKNIGGGTAYDICIEELFSLFQPVSKEDTYAFYKAEYNVDHIQWMCNITPKSYLTKGGTLFLKFFVTPVMVHVGYKNIDLTPSVGTFINISYKDVNGKSDKVSFQLGLSHDTDQIPIDISYTNALAESDYLIITRPERLLSRYNSYHIDFIDLFNKVFSKMAELAVWKKGVIGLFYNYKADYYTSAEDDNRDLIKKLLDPNPESSFIQKHWATKLSQDFFDAAKGYVLIIGDTQIIPAWTLYFANKIGTVHNSDNGYASTDIYGEPELVIGRITGNINIIIKALQTSIDRGPSGYTRSKALLIGGGGKNKVNMHACIDNIESTADKVFVDVTKEFYETQQELKLSVLRKIMPENDFILYNGHAGSNGWSFATVTFSSQLLDFKGSNPIIYSNGCQSGGGYFKNYILDSKAGVFIGPTEDTLEYGAGTMEKHMLDNWGSSTSIGEAFTLAERGYITLEGGAVVATYNIYGDPKYGKSSLSLINNQQEPSTLGSPASQIIVEIPDYLVTNNYCSNGLDLVEIPGGKIHTKEGELMVPFYTKSVDYPPGYEIKDVTLTTKAQFTTDVNINLPMSFFNISGGFYTLEPYRGPVEDFFPEYDFNWYIFKNSDGSTTLNIDIYPFTYNPLTTHVKFYQNFVFDIVYTSSEVNIIRLQTDKKTYSQGEKVNANIDIFNSGNPQDVIFEGVIVTHGSNTIVDGLLQRSLDDFNGSASYTAVWDSNGFECGYYNIDVTLKDFNGNVLERASQRFRIGIYAGEITDFEVTPKNFYRGDPVKISIEFENTGTTNISGNSIVEIVNYTGKTVKTFVHDIMNLKPDESIRIQEDWDTTDFQHGLYKIIGRVNYDSKSTPVYVINVTSKIMIPPVADANGPYEGIVGIPVEFHGSASSGTPPYNYYWSFGDNVYSSAQNPSHTYDEEGDYTVSLRVTDDNYMSDTDYTHVLIHPPETVLADAGGPYSGDIGETVQFSGSVIGGTEPYSWYWEFGDGGISTIQNPTHTYTAVDEYTATLTVTDTYGKIDDDTAMVTINSHPPDKPSKPSGSISGKAGEEYTYSTSTTDPDGDQIWYKWYWNDKINETSDWIGPYNSGETAEASHIWDEKGDYIIRVKAKDVHGEESPWSDPLAISMPKNKAINLFLLFLERLIERFPILEQILQPIYDKLAGL